MDGWKTLTMGNPEGFEDAVNGSYYKNEGNESAIFIRSVGRYINELEYKLEKK
jgi:hypothetical protein